MSIGDNINGFGTQNPDAQTLGETTNVQGTSQTPAELEAAYYKSSIEQSELEALVSMLAAGFPTLQPPQFVAMNYRELGAVGAVNGASATVQLSAQSEQIKNDIISSMWEAFLARVHEMAELARKEDIQRWAVKVEESGGPKSASEYHAYLMTLAVGPREKEVNGNDPLTVQFDKTFHNWFISPNDGSTQAIVNPLAFSVERTSNDYPSSAFIAGSLVSAIGMLDGPTAGFNQTSISPVADALYALGPNSNLPGDYQAAAALIAALLYGGAVYKATNDDIEVAAKTAKPPQDLDFAINFANSVMAIVTHSMSRGEPLEKERGQQNKLVRLMLNLMALNMVFRAKYGGMSGEDLKALLAGNTADLHADVKKTVEDLVALINLDLPEDTPMSIKYRSEMIVGMMQYVDNKNSVDSMLQTKRMLNSYLAASEDEDFKRLASGQG